MWVVFVFGKSVKISSAKILAHKQTNPHRQTSKPISSGIVFKRAELQNLPRNVVQERDVPKILWPLDFAELVEQLPADGLLVDYVIITYI